MKLNSIYQLFAASVVLVISCTTAYAQQVSIPKCASEDTQGIMSPDYWAIWNDEEQKRIDNDIEKYRKADGSFTVGKVKKGTTVKVEQVSHEFIFGAHIFNYNQLGKKEYNDRYKDLFGGLFNSATVAFYWKKFETQPGRLRFNTEYWDTEEYWNSCEDPYSQPHWRRPPTDDIIKFCKEKGIRVHGHTLIWGNRGHQHPEWLYDLMTPEEHETYLNKFKGPNSQFGSMSTDDIYALLPHYCDTVAKLMESRIRTLADYYKDTIDSWDVVNESAVDYARGNFVKDQKVCKSVYGVMPAEYTYKYFKVATDAFPKNVKLNINDYHRQPAYAEQVKELVARGCKVDIMGVQMHLFNPNDCIKISEGAKIQTPQEVRQYLTWLSEPGLPLHMSEITISAPDKSAKGQMIQAIITRNLYRLWFSGEKVMGITWWNTVDACGLKNEPAISGILTRDMKEKPAYQALDELINKEWKTSVEVQPDKDGNISWRGFKGKYRITWISPKGKEMTEEVVLK